jgi:pimeloyl-ACP methyl ester carboxylesterase
VARPDIFPRRVLLGSGAGVGASFPFNTANGAKAPQADYTPAELDAEFAKLDPPRRAYQDYWASRQADYDMKHVPQGMHAFFRAFYYMKSHDFPGNQNLPPLKPVHTARDAAVQNAQMPEYYVMRRDRSMPATMIAYMPSADYIANCKWFTEAECEVYASEYQRSGWNGGLHVYRRGASLPNRAELMMYSGRSVDVPAMVISGRQDWGANRTIGGPEHAGDSGFTQFKGVYMVDQAGHWVHEEQPEQVSQHLLNFLRQTA